MAHYSPLRAFSLHGCQSKVVALAAGARPLSIADTLAAQTNATRCHIFSIPFEAKSLGSIGRWVAEIEFAVCRSEVTRRSTTPFQSRDQSSALTNWEGGLMGSHAQGISPLVAVVGGFVGQSWRWTTRGMVRREPWHRRVAGPFSAEPHATPAGHENGEISSQPVYSQLGNATSQPQGKGFEPDVPASVGVQQVDQ